MQKVTQKDLEKLVERINTMAGTPQTPWVNGKSQDGCYLLEKAYGGQKLVQILGEGGAERDVLATGYTTKSNLCNAMHSFIKGFEKGREVTEQHWAQADAGESL